MANFTNYQESRGAMLMLEQRGAIDTKPAAPAATGDTGEPPSPSPVIHIGGSGSGGSRFHQHLPPSNHHHHHLHYPQNTQPKDQQHPVAHHHHYQSAQQQQHLPGEHMHESPVRKSSSSSLNLVHEDPSAAASTSQAHAAASLSGTAASIAAHFSVSTSDAVDDIRKCGYLRKQKHGHKRFFVLRAGSHLGPSRLEYYDSEKKFRNCLRSAAAAAASTASGAVASSPPKRVIYLYQCFTVNKRADSKNKHLIALYTKDEYFAIVAENEEEQEDWYVALSELMSEGKRGHVDSDDLDDGYGTVTPGTVFKEVWQVNVKPKGLGQTKNLTGVYRLCLSTKTIHLVKLNSETPCVNLQLMNIRRCGHSESFFFIEVGRSSSIGPGEIWMYVDDSVVAQNMHETILETMKALKAFAEFRPRSKSQSSGSNPIPFITTRRHLGNLPPSQTGLQRRSRTESVVGTPPSSKSTGASGYRFRTSSEGEGTMNRPFRSVTGSLVHLNSARIHLGRQESGGGSTGSSTGTGAGGGGGSSNRYARALPSSSYHARSASLPVSHFPSATSPVSVSSSSGHGSVSDTLTRPSSASICGSPSDGGFNSSDEYGSSPGDFRYFRVRSNTPDSLGNTPPIREENCLSDYMAMGWHREVFGPAGTANAETPRDEGASTEDERSSSSVRRRTHSFSRPAGGASGVAVYQQMMTQTTFSQDEGVGEGLSLGRPPSSSSSSLRSDYSSCSEHSQSRPALPRLHPDPAPPSSSAEDSGYVPMTCGVATPRDTPPDYMPMQPSSSLPPPHPRLSSSPLLHSPALSRRSPHTQPTDSHGYMMMLPGGGGNSSSPVQASPSPQSSRGTGGGPGGSGVSANASERPENGEYMDMSYSVSGGGKKVSNEGYFALSTPDTPKSYSPYFSLPRSYKAPAREREEKEQGEYVPMRSPAKPVYSSSSSSSVSSSTPEKRGGMAGSTPPSHPPPPYGAQHVTGVDRRVVRPNRLPLSRRSFHGSPGASVANGNGSPAHAPAVPTVTEGPSSPGEYINIEFGDQYPSSCSLSAKDGAPSPGPGDPQRSLPQPPAPQQDYMSVDVVPKRQSPRPSLVAPWNPPSYIRPLAAASGVLAPSSGGPGGHWKSGGDDYTDMTFGLGGGDGARGSRSPTAMLQHLCVMESHYQALTLAPAPSPTTPLSSSPQGEPPKVVRADPQGRRRHSSETFASASTHPPSSSPAAPNGSHPPSEASRWPASGSFDSVWMCVEGQGGLADPRAQPGASDVGLAPTGTASSGGGRECHQNGLNYIALELRGEAGPVAPHLNGGHQDGRTGSPTGALPLPENRAYASIDFSKPDAVTATTKD